MRISVILPTNRPQGPFYALHSLAKQTFPKEDFELLIIDDFHMDRGDLIIDMAEHLHLENIRVLRSKPNYWRSNRLIANARNTGLIHAEGELIVFLDDFCWVSPRWLEEHWLTYQRTPYTMIGAGNAVRYISGRYDDLDQLSPPDVGNNVDGAFIRNLAQFKVSDTRGPNSKRDCGGGWFYTMNASAPLEKIVRVNGFDEEYDLTSEEDIDLGLRLERIGCRFFYRPDHDCTVFHVDHREVDAEMRKLPKRYSEVTYDDLRNRGVLDSEEDEVQLVLKEKYGVKYDGSWGLHERNRKRQPYAVNLKINPGVREYFNLKEERVKR